MYAERVQQNPGVAHGDREGQGRAQVLEWGVCPDCTACPARSPFSEGFLLLLVDLTARTSCLSWGWALASGPLTSVQRAGPVSLGHMANSWQWAVSYMVLPLWHKHSQQTSSSSTPCTQPLGCWQTVLQRHEENVGFFHASKPLKASAGSSTLPQGACTSHSCCPCQSSTHCPFSPCIFLQ